MNNTHRHFICARVDAVADYIERVKKNHPGYLADDSATRFLAASCPQFLLSLGAVMQKGRAVRRRDFDKFRRLIRTLRAAPYLAGCELSIDNGGYQVQQGFLTPAQLSPFIHQFYNFINSPALPVDWTFTLDLAPGKENVFTSERQLMALNEMSYGLAAALPQSIRQRVIYIEHFRTLELLRIWRRLRENEFPKAFENFGTGGLASSKRRSNPPCIAYVIPLIRILLDAKSRGITALRFHVLGASQFNQLFAHSLFERHVWHTHRIQLHITCDSTIVFSKFAMSLHLPVANTERRIISDISLHPSDLFTATHTGETNIEAFCRTVGTSLVPFGMLPLVADRSLLFQQRQKGQSVTHLGYCYGILVYLHQYYLAEHWCREAVALLYPLFLAGDDDTFVQEAAHFITAINETSVDATVSPGATKAAVRCLNSLKLLSSLDWDNCTFIVDRYLNCPN